MNINHISVSRKKCYDLCSQQYKYRYHLKIARPGEEPVYFLYGTILHKIAEVFVRGRAERSLGEIATDVLRGKIELREGEPCPPLPEEYKKKLPVHLRSIQNLTDQIGTEGLIEYEFHYDLDPPHKRHITGFIDRLILKNDKAFIIDYKTTKKGKWRVDKETVKTDLQLRCYARVVQREFGIKAENIKAALYYVEGGNLIAASYSESSLAQVEEDLKNSYITIENAHPDKVWGNVGWHCKNCDYCTICPFYKSNSTTKADSWDGSFETL